MIATGHGTPYLRPLYVQIVSSIAPKTVLDVGAGTGETGRYIRTLTGVPRMDAIEVHPACAAAIPDGAYDTVWVGDARAFQPEGHELVLCLDVLEHMPKEDGLAFLRRHVASGARMLIAIPRDALSPTRNGGVKDGNIFEAHVSEWTDSDFTEFRRTVYARDEHIVMVLGGRDADGDHA